MGLKFKFTPFKLTTKVEVTTVPQHEAGVKELTPKEIAHNEICNKIAEERTFYVPFKDVPNGVTTFKTSEYAKMVITTTGGSRVIPVLSDNSFLPDLCNMFGLNPAEWTAMDMTFDVISTVANISENMDGIFYCTPSFFATKNEIFFTVDEMNDICKATNIKDKVIKRGEPRIVQVFLETQGLSQEKALKMTNKFISHPEIFRDLYHYTLINRFKTSGEYSVYGYTASKLAGPPYNFEPFIAFNALATLSEEGICGNMFNHLKTTEKLHQPPNVTPRPSGDFER